MPQASRLSWIKEQVCGAVLRVRAFSDGPSGTVLSLSHKSGLALSMGQVYV